jgi:hypothetical protein
VLCEDNLCSVNVTSEECGICLKDKVQGCGNELTACLEDL